MNLPAHFIPNPWPFFSHFVLFFIVLYHVVKAPWYKILQSDSQHIFFAAIIALSLVWSVKAGISPGLTMHFLGAMVFYLMFGYQFSIFGLLLVLTVVTIYGNSGWDSFSINALLMIIIPVFVCHQLFSFSDKKLPNNFFVYVLFNAFMGSAVAILSCLLANTILLLNFDIYNYDKLAYEYLPFFPLLILPEALLSGIIMSIIVAYFPTWVSTFDDSRYLKVNKDQD